MCVAAGGVVKFLTGTECVATVSNQYKVCFYDVLLVMCVAKV